MTKLTDIIGSSRDFHKIESIKVRFELKIVRIKFRCKTRYRHIRLDLRDGEWDYFGKSWKTGIATEREMRMIKSIIVKCKLLGIYD